MRSAMGETSFVPQQQPSLGDKIFVIGLQLSSSSIFTFVYLLLWVVGIGFTIYSLEMRVDLVDAMLSNHTSRVGDDAGASQAEIAELHSHTSYWHQFTLTFVLGIDTTLLVLSVVRATPLFSPDLRYWPRNLVLSLALNVGTFAATLAYRVTVGYTSSTGLLGWRVSDWASLAYWRCSSAHGAAHDGRGRLVGARASWRRRLRTARGASRKLRTEESLDEGTAADVAAAAAAATAAAAEAEARREAERSRRASEERTTIAQSSAAAAARGGGGEASADPVHGRRRDQGAQPGGARAGDRGADGSGMQRELRPDLRHFRRRRRRADDRHRAPSRSRGRGSGGGSSGSALRRSWRSSRSSTTSRAGVFASDIHMDRFLSDHYFPSIGLSADEPLPPANPTAGSDRAGPTSS